MTPILRKSKEAAKHIMKSSRSYRDNRPINSGSRFLRSRGGRGRRLFLTSRSRLASLARGSHLAGNDHRGSRDHHTLVSVRYASWFNRSDSPYSKYSVQYKMYHDLLSSSVLIIMFFLQRIWQSWARCSCSSRSICSGLHAYHATSITSIASLCCTSSLRFFTSTATATQIL